MRNFLLSIFIFSLILSFCPIKAQVTDKIAPNKEFYQSIDNFIKKEMRKSNVDPEKGRYNFVVALSTSHFSSDQRNVVAMKQASCLIANNFCTSLDSISSVAWELDVWDMSPTFKFSEDGKERKDFVNSLPKTPMDQSKGGHDTYRSLMTILKKVDKPESTIVILITNSHESRGPIGEHYTVIGKNSKELKTLLDEKGFRSPEDNSFSFYFEGNKKPTDIFVTLALPKDLKSIDNNSENRYPSFPYSTWVPEENKPNLDVLPELVKEETKSNVAPKKTPNPTETTTTTTEEKKGGLPIVPIVIVAVIVLGGIIFAVMPKNKGDKPKGAKKGNTHKFAFTFADTDYEEELEENKVYEMMFFDDTFKLRAKVDEANQGQSQEENADEIPEDAIPVFEISYSVESDAFMFEMLNSSISSDPSEMGELQECGTKKYMIKNGLAGSCMVDFNKNEYTLMVG